MVKKVTLRKMGGSVGTTIPKDLAERLHLGPGDELFLIETADGVLLTPYDPDFGEEMEAYGRIAARYRNTLRDLAR